MDDSREGRPRWLCEIEDETLSSAFLVVGLAGKVVGEVTATPVSSLSDIRARRAVSCTGVIVSSVLVPTTDVSPSQFGSSTERGSVEKDIFSI